MTVQRYVGIFLAANQGQNLARRILRRMCWNVNENIPKIIFIYSIKFYVASM